MYAILDKQSNASLATSDFFNLFQVEGPQLPYKMSSCSGSIGMYGRRATGFVVESVAGDTHLKLPPLIECDDIPNFRHAIPTPAVAVNFEHLRDLSEHIPAIEEDAEILLLIGRDLTRVHHVLDQCLGPVNLPYAQKLPLGWVIVGEACLERFTCRTL